MADGTSLTLDVGEEEPVVVALQPLLDEGSEDDLQAYGHLERRGRLAGKDSGLIHNVLGQDEKDLRLVREHRTSFGYVLRAACPVTNVRPDVSGLPKAPVLHSCQVEILYVLYFLYH